MSAPSACLGAKPFLLDSFACAGEVLSAGAGFSLGASIIPEDTVAVAAGVVELCRGRLYFRRVAGLDVLGQCHGLLAHVLRPLLPLGGVLLALLFRRHMVLAISATAAVM